MTALNEFGFSYLYDEELLPPGSDRRLQVATNCDRYPHPPLAHLHPPELIIDGWGEHDADYTEAAHTHCLSEFSLAQAQAVERGYQQVYAAFLRDGDVCKVTGVGAAVYRDGDLIHGGRAIHPQLESVFVVRTQQTLRQMAEGVFTLPSWA
jgi:hypothetical protein